MDTLSKTFSATGSTDSYPTHKTVSLIEERVIADKKVAAQEINAAGNYPIHKTITILAEQNSIKTEATPTVNKPSYEDSYTAGNYPAHKTVVILKEEITVTTTKSDSKADSSYPAHKTVDIDQLRVMQQTERIPDPVNREPLTDNKSKSETAEKTITTNTTKVYPDHKTYSFVKETSANSLNEEKSNETTVLSEKEKNKVAETRVADNSKIPGVAPAIRAKKPVLWIAASGILLISSGATAWYAYQQKKNLQEEIVALRKENETLAETVKKMEKQLHFDDIIARAGKLDTTNNIAVMENASSSEVVRLCFSVTANPQAKNRSRQVIYIRFIDANNTVLSHRKENLFDYKGASIPFSIKRVIDAVNDEMMICADYKPAEKLQKGTYKAEIYNEGVLDGTTTFELK